MTNHSEFSIIAEIKPGMKQSLIDLLAIIEQGKNDKNGLIPFTAFKGIHFARLLILNQAVDTAGKTIPDRLTFTTNYDLPANHIDDLVALAGPGLWRVFTHCSNFATGNYNAAQLKEYLQRNSRKANVFYMGVGPRSVQQINDENMLRSEIEKYVDDNKTTLRGKSATTIRSLIVSYIASHKTLNTMVTSARKPTAMWQVKHYGALALVVLIALILSPVLLPLIIVWVLLILIKELKDKPVVNIVTNDHMRELIDRETGMVQCQFSAVGNMKPGWLRLQTMLILLKVVDFMAPYIFSKGRLSGIPTVHFARWLIIDEGRQMLFLSNYDGNTESYLTDFINIAAKQLTLLFSHTMGYPKTYLMMFGGAKDARKFLEWAHFNQTVTNVWYNANPGVNVKNVFHNSKIREGLHGSMSEHEAKKWLRLI